MERFINIFKNRIGHYRAGWRILFYIILFVALSEFLEFVSNSYLLISGDKLNAYELLYNRVINKSLKLLSVLIPAFLLLKWIDKRPLTLLGLGFYKGTIKELSYGIIFGLAMAVTGVLTTYLSGLGSFTLNEIKFDLIGYLVAVLGILFISAIYEEVLFRGYIFQSSIEGTNFPITLIIFSLLFGAAHLSNAGIDVFGIMFTISAGLFLGVMYYKTRALWMCIGTHFVWNWTVGPIFGMGVEQNPFLRMTLFKCEYIESGLIGGLGALSDLLQSIIFIILTIIIWKSKWLKPSKYNVELWSKYPFNVLLKKGG